MVLSEAQAPTNAHALRMKFLIRGWSAPSDRASAKTNKKDLQWWGLPKLPAGAVAFRRAAAAGRYPVDWEVTVTADARCAKNSNAARTNPLGSVQIAAVAACRLRTADTRAPQRDDRAEIYPDLGDPHGDGTAGPAPASGAARLLVSFWAPDLPVVR